MTPKKRFETAMRHEQPDDMVSFMELEFHIYEEFIGKNLVVGYEFQKLPAAEKERALQENAEIMVATAEKAGHDAIRSIAHYWEISPGQPAYLWLPDEQSILDQIKALKKAAGNKYFLIGSVGSNMGIPDGNHMYEYITDLYERPDEIKKQNEGMLKYAIEWQWKQIDAGADTVANLIDVAFNTGTFISPQLMDEFHFPYFNRWVDSLKNQGLISIWHTDGNIMGIIDRVIESGVTAIQCVDPIAGMDIVAIKQKVKNKLALIGNIDCSLLQLDTAQNIEKEVKRVVEGCREGGGFVLGACNAIFKGIPAENYMVMAKARKQYGSYWKT
jgi:uroporphyrinogen decarboxylase